MKNILINKTFLIIGILSFLILLLNFPTKLLSQGTNTNSTPSIESQTRTIGEQRMQETVEDFTRPTITIRGGSSASNPGASTNSLDQQKEVDPSRNNILPVQGSTEADSAEADALTEVISCSAGAIVGNFLTATISKGLDAIFGSLLETEVPVEDAPHRSKEVGSLVIWGIPVLPSWDAVAYCLANAIIVYVADSTIAWIQSGFEGKPAFVDDPTKLFQDLADYEVSNFLENLGGGFLCEPFEAYVINSLVNDYTGGYSQQGKCTLDQVQGNVESFISGDSFSYDVFFATTQNPANNPYGSYLMARSEAQNRIQLGIGPIKEELDWNNGYFSWRAKDGPNAGKVVTPGNVIETQLEDRLGLAPDRLVLAEKFDQVISTLVNYLIKTALTETLGAIKSATN
jgi:hypothetical protein